VAKTPVGEQMGETSGAFDCVVRRRAWRRRTRLKFRSLGTAPLAAAHDAEVIDTTMLDADAVFEHARQVVARTLEEKEWQQ